jgi:hypothetical protein
LILTDSGQPITSTTRAAAVVFGGHLSARAAFWLDIENSEFKLVQICNQHALAKDC